MSAHFVVAFIPSRHRMRSIWPGDCKIMRNMGSQIGQKVGNDVSGAAEKLFSSFAVGVIKGIHQNNVSCTRGTA